MNEDNETLNQFIGRQLDELTKFKIMWLAGQKDISKLFPDKLPPGEWDEQLRLFEEK